MYRASIPYGRGGVLAHALSAIDIALWDLKGRKLGIPVCDLLGGRRREKMPAYASHLQPVGETRLRAEAAGYLAEGYRAMKMRMVGGPADGLAGVRRNIDTVALIREVVGPDIELMVDAYMGWDLRFATAMADALAEFDISWIEEPLIPDQWWAYAKLAQTTSIPIAQGENIFMPSEFLRIAKNGEASVLQPDVHRCGGITGFRRIAQIAESHGLEIAPHAYSAPTVQVCAALGNVKMLEKLTIPAWVEEPDAPPPSAFLGEPDVINGMVDPGWAPGLGISPNPDHPDIPRHWLL
jgi:L-alanine-DL-glutamate epimerase-like enolase superfamily enzyme